MDRYSLVAHDWGALALALAQAEPERVERLVLLDAVPLLPGYEWHKLARQWRRPLVGEMAMGFTFKFVTRRLLRLPDGSEFPAEPSWTTSGTTSTTAPSARSCACTGPRRRARWRRRAPTWAG